ncbi:MAG: holo-ACP synthase [Polyangiaceae bacterium]
MSSHVFGMGIDLVDVAPLRRSLARYGNRILRHVFTPVEITRGSTKRDPARFFAECFAVKEAAFKALGTGWQGELRWQDVAVGSAPGSSCLALEGEFKRLAAESGVVDARVSFSSTSSVACAVVVLSSKIERP